MTFVWIIVCSILLVFGIALAGLAWSYYRSEQIAKHGLMLNFGDLDRIPKTLLRDGVEGATAIIMNSGGEEIIRLEKCYDSGRSKNIRMGFLKKNTSQNTLLRIKKFVNSSGCHVSSTVYESEGKALFGAYLGASYENIGEIVSRIVAISEGKSLGSILAVKYDGIRPVKKAFERRRAGQL